MNISKYIELFRFYFTEKIEELNMSLKNALTDDLRNITISLISALFSLFISNESITSSGILPTIIKCTIPIPIFVIIRLIISKLVTRSHSKKAIKKADTKELSFQEAKNFVDKFDHIACDGIILSWDFLKKYTTTAEEKKNEKQFYLIEAFYYYKKSLDIMYLIVMYKDKCINSAHNTMGVSLYRLINVYNSLGEIQNTIDKYLNNCHMPKHETIENEITIAKDKMKIITDCINKEFS